MAIMVKEKGEISSYPSQDPWEVTEEIKESLKETRKLIEERKERFENQIIPCPIDGKPSKFVKYQGAYTRVVGVFKCENGHEFNHG